MIFFFRYNRLQDLFRQLSLAGIFFLRAISNGQSPAGETMYSDQVLSEDSFTLCFLNGLFRKVNRRLILMQTA